MGEIGIAVFTAMAVLFAGPSELPFAIGLAWILFGLAQFDAVHGRLPDALTLGLCLLGLTSSVLAGALVPSAAGVAGGILISSLVASLYRLTTHRDGLGCGDIKLFGASGAWVGWESLPVLLVVSSSSALLFLAANRRVSRLERLSFGPFIAFATLAIWCWQRSSWRYL